MVRCREVEICAPIGQGIRWFGRCNTIIPFEPSICRQVSNRSIFAVNGAYQPNPLIMQLAECDNPCLTQYRTQIVYLVTCPRGKVGGCCIDNACCCQIDLNPTSWNIINLPAEVLVIEEGENDPDLLRICVDVFGDFQPIQQQGHFTFNIVPCENDLSADVRFEGAFLQFPLRGDDTCFGYVEGYEITLRGDPLFDCQNELIGTYSFSIILVECICLGTLRQPPPPPSEEGWENTKEDSEVLLGLTVGSMAYEDMLDLHNLRQIRIR
ncbi:MAG: hypothetical protein QXO37_09450 [Candidatus Nitrosocaldaceae archaeon]